MNQSHPASLPDHTVLNEYRQFVLNKAAPAYPIIDPRHFDLFHASLGLATEFLELELSTTKENTHEELNDLGWYLQLTANSLNIVPSAMSIYTKRESTELTLITLRRTLEKFLSCCKKVLIYRNEQQAANLNALFVNLWAAYLIHLVACGYNLQLAIAENMDKLNKRYAAKFTKEESIQRKDKA